MIDRQPRNSRHTTLFASSHSTQALLRMYYWIINISWNLAINRAFKRWAGVVKVNKPKRGPRKLPLRNLPNTVLQKMVSWKVEVFFYVLNSFHTAWVAYQGKVYDVSNWEDHPGDNLLTE